MNTATTPPSAADTNIIGAIKLADMDLTLCDYIEAVNGQWYALAYCNAAHTYTNTYTNICEQKNLQNTLFTKPNPSRNAAENAGKYIAYVPAHLLRSAVPYTQHKNNAHSTRALIGRLTAELSQLNGGMNDGNRTCAPCV